MTSVNTRRIMTVLLTVALMLSLLTVAVNATGDVTTVSPETTAAPAETTAAPGETTAAPGETTAAPETTAAAGDDEGGPNWDIIITLSVIGLAVVVFIVLYFVLAKFRVWVQTMAREYRSELKKVVWSPWRDVKRNTLVVIVIVAASALVIGLLDFVFSQGIIALGGLF